MLNMTYYWKQVKMSSVDSSLDIICLSQPPLHVTPLFRYIKEGKFVIACPYGVIYHFH